MDRKRTMKRPSVHAHAARRPFSAAVAVAVVVVLALAGFAVARYALQQQEEGLATAADFYFTSDYLKEGGASYFIDPATTVFSIALINSADAQRFSSGGIEYTVAAHGASVGGPDAGTLEGGRQSAVTLTVTPTAQGSFTVTATSASPYVKELTATFTLQKGNHYAVEDATGNAAAVLTITCADSGGPVALSLPAGVVPDATDSRVTPAPSGYTFSPNGSGVYSIVLLKSDKTKELTGAGDFADEIDLSTLA